VFQQKYVFVDMDCVGADNIRPRAHIMRPYNEWFHTCCFISHQQHLKHANIVHEMNNINIITKKLW